MKFLIFDREENYIGTLKDVLEAKQTEEINGEDVLELAVLEQKVENISDTYARNFLLSSGVPIDLSDQPVIETESGDVFEVQGDEWGRNLLLNSGEPSPITMRSNNHTILPLETGVEDGVNWMRGVRVADNTFNINSYVKETFSSNYGTRYSNELENYDGPVTYSVEVMSEYPLYVAIAQGTRVLLEPNVWTRISHTRDEGKGARPYGLYALNNPEAPLGTKLYWRRYKIEKGSKATPWTPAPEDFANFKGKEYHLSEPLVKDEWYTLTVQGDFSPDAFVGVWAGDGFVGYLQDGKMTFKLTEDIEVENLIIKSSDEQGEIERVKLERGEYATPWSPAPEEVDIQPHYAIEKGYKIVYKNKMGHWKEFTIKEIEESHTNDGIEKRLFCESSFYETLGDYVEDKRPYNTTANIALEDALLTTRWEVGQIDNLGYNSTNFYHISAKEAVQKVAETWQGEIRTRITISGNKITGRYVDLLSKRGQDLGKRFSYTKDLESITRIIHRDDVITALYGYGKGEEIEDEEGNATGGFGRRIDFAEINDGKAYVENNDAREIWGRNNPDGTKSHVFGKVEFDDCEDKQELLDLTIAKLDEVSQPLITYEAKVIDLKAFGFEHEGVELGDTVTVIDKEFTPELRVKARVVKIVRDLLEPENNEITLGNFIANITDMWNKQEEYIKNFRDKQGVWDRARIIDNDGTINAQFLNNLIDELNTRMNSQGGYVYLSEDGKGIITTDKPTIEESTMAIQLLGGGFRIANSKLPNGEFDWRTFGDGNGFLADAFVGGLLKGGKVHFDLTNGTLLIGDSIENYQLYFDGNILKINLANEKPLDETIEIIEDKVIDIEEDMTNWSTLAATKAELGEVITSLNMYREALEKAEIDLGTATDEIANLLQRVPAIELQLGNFVQSLQFVDTYMRLGEEGLIIGSKTGATAIRITDDRIDFLDGSGEPVAYITNQIMRINRGIFVDSAQIGGHKIETIAAGHTIFTWVEHTLPYIVLEWSYFSMPLWENIGDTSWGCAETSTPLEPYTYYEFHTNIPITARPEPNERVWEDYWEGGIPYTSPDIPEVIIDTTDWWKTFEPDNPNNVTIIEGSPVVFRTDENGGVQFFMNDWLINRLRDGIYEIKALKIY